MEIVPTVEFPPVMPSTAQVTLALALPVTDLVKRWVASSVTVSVVGEIVTVCAASGTASARIRRRVGCQNFLTITLEDDSTRRKLVEATGKCTYLELRAGLRNPGCELRLTTNSGGKGMGLCSRIASRDTILVEVSRIYMVFLRVELLCRLEIGAKREAQNLREGAWQPQLYPSWER